MSREKEGRKKGRKAGFHQIQAMVRVRIGGPVHWASVSRFTQVSQTF